MRAPSATSNTWTFFEGRWRGGNAPFLGPRSHAAWLGSIVFDGARAFEGVAPDLDSHLNRVNLSAKAMLLEPRLSRDDWRELVEDGLRRFDKLAALYIRPMYWPEEGIGGGVRFEPSSTKWALTIYEAPMPPSKGAAITLSPFRRPSNEFAPVEAKASCHYANGARALIEASKRGFDNCLMRDAAGAIAEFANANAFLVKGGRVLTPVPNGTFLNGITRRRIISLLRSDGIEVVETTLQFGDFLEADEIFSTGNFQKVAPITSIDERSIPEGPIFRRARQIYWDFAHSRAPCDVIE